MTVERDLWALGERVSLSAVRAEDRRLHYQAWLDPQVQRNFNTPLPWPTFEAYLAFQDRPGRPKQRFTATVVALPEGRVAGLVSLTPDRTEPDLAIVLHPRFRGRGLGTEAMRLAVALVFERFDLPYLVAGAYEHNHASIRMLEKVGFRRAPDRDAVEENRFGEGTTRQLAFRFDRI